MGNVHRIESPGSKGDTLFKPRAYADIEAEMVGGRVNGEQKLEKKRTEFAGEIRGECGLTVIERTGIRSWIKE